MRIKCSFTLEPDLFEHHSDAEKTLRQWRTQLQLSDDNVDIVRGRVDNFHRQIYLSGLYLHNLKPELPLMLSQNFSQKIASDNFFNLLAATGLTSNMSQSEAGLSELQWQQLTSLVSGINTKKADTSASDNTDLIAHLSSIAESQEQIVHQLTGLQEQKGNVAPLDNDLLLTLQQNQAITLAQLKIIRNQITQLNTNGNISVDKVEEQDLDAQLSKASRVKAKGLW